MNYSPCGWMILWLDDTDWLTGDLFTQWLNYPVTDWPIDLVIFNQSIKIYLVLFNIVTGWPCNWLLLWLIDQWLIDPLTNTVWLNDPVSERHWLIGWWLNDPLTKWPSDWKTLTGDWLTQWLIDPVIDWHCDWLIPWLTDIVVDWSSDWLTKWLINPVTDPLIDWSCDDWMTQWLIDPVTDWPNDWLTQWLFYPEIYSPNHLFTL